MSRSTACVLALITITATALPAASGGRSVILPPAPGSRGWANSPAYVMPQVNIPGVPATVYPTFGPGPVGPQPGPRPYPPGPNQPMLIVPEVNLPPAEPAPAAVDESTVVLGEFNACLANGVVDIVDCLRGNHTSVMIRRLEACLGAEQIPPNPADARPCLAAGIQ